MGRLVRTFMRTTKMVLGTDGSPITINAANRIALEIGQTFTVAGTSEGIKSSIHGSITSGNLSLYGVHSVVEVLTGKAMGSGEIRGVYTEVNVIGTATIIAGAITGVRAELYAEAGVTMADVYGMAVFSYMLKQPGGTYEMLRLEEDGSAYPAQVIGVYVPDATYFLRLSPQKPSHGAWDGDTNHVGGKTPQGGIRVQIALEGARWIPLYLP